MDVDMIKASQRAAEENMDMMAAIMQIEKLRDEFSDDQDHTFNTTTTTTLPLPSHEIQFSNVSTFPPSFANPSPLPFMNVQEPNTPPLHQSNGGGRFKTSSSSFGLPNGSPSPYNNDSSSTLLEKMNSMAAMREMIFRIAAMQPIHIDPESIKPPKRRNVKISKDPQSVAARHRRERISERIRILQRLVPGGTKMDTASMLDEAIHYVKFLKKQVQTLEHAGAHRPTMAAGVGFPGAASLGNVSTVGYPSHMVKACHQQPPHQHLMIDNVNMHMFRS